MNSTVCDVTPTQPSLKGAKLPNGHIIFNIKHQQSPLTKAISDSGLVIHYDDSIGLIDCYPSATCALVIAQAGQVVNQSEIKRKLKKLIKFPHTKIFLVEIDETSDQYFYELQNEFLLDPDHKLKVLRYSGVKEASLLITQLNHVDASRNPFLNKPKSKKPIDESILAFIQSLPGIGEKKALDLLKKFHSIKSISEASLEDICQVVGKQAALSLKEHLGT